MWGLVVAADALCPGHHVVVVGDCDVPRALLADAHVSRPRNQQRFIYCLAVAAQRYRIRVLFTLAMSTVDG